VLKQNTPPDQRASEGMFCWPDGVVLPVVADGLFSRLEGHGDELGLTVHHTGVVSLGIFHHGPRRFRGWWGEQAVWIGLGQDRIADVGTGPLDFLGVGELGRIRDRIPDRRPQEDQTPLKLVKHVGVGHESLLVSELDDVLHDLPLTEVLHSGHADR